MAVREQAGVQDLACDKMKISIVTPSFGRLDFLEETISSVINQSGPFRLQYIVQDGGSGREIIDVYERWSKRLKTGAQPVRCEGVEFSWHVERDHGVYDAVSRGFARADGDVLAWLNTDDIYHHGALNTVARAFAGFPDVDWLTGEQTLIDETGSVVTISTFPASYSRHFLQRGFYQSSNAASGFPFVQQESTFWRSDLWRDSGGFPDTRALASDYQLWRRFAERTDLVKIHTILGALRMHCGQLSGNAVAYAAGLADAEGEVKQAVGVIQSIKRLIQEDSSKRFVVHEPGFHNPSTHACGMPVEWFSGRNIIWDGRSRSWKIARVPVVAAGFHSVREAVEILNDTNPMLHLPKARSLAGHSLVARALHYYDLHLADYPEDLDVVLEREALFRTLQ